MDFKEDLREKMQRFIDALIEDFGGIDTPLTRMNIVLFSHFLESQGILLKFYKEYLDERTGQDDVCEENVKEMIKKFLRAYLEMLALQRKSRADFKKVQAEIAQDYFDIVQESLHHIRDKMSKHRTSSSASE